jgi:hypothetical protein
LPGFASHRCRPGRRRQLHLVLDPLDAGGQHRGERQIGVDVGAADAALDPDALVPSPHSRKPAVRLSTDQTVLVGAKVPFMKRL